METTRWRVMEEKPNLVEIVTLYLRSLPLMNYEERTAIFSWLKLQMNPPFLVYKEPTDGPQSTL